MVPDEQPASASAANAAIEYLTSGELALWTVVKSQAKKTGMENTLKIGQVARQSDVRVDTVRYYERVGLLPAPPRRASGYRAYPWDTPRRILFIKRAQELGFSLQEIRELLDLRASPGSTCDDVRRRAEDKLVAVDQKIAALQRIRAALQELTGACIGEGPISACPVLDALDGKPVGAG